MLDYRTAISSIAAGRDPEKERARERERDENFEKENKTNKEEKKKRTDAIRNLRATNDGGPDQASREGQGEGLGGRGGWEEVLV